MKKIFLLNLTILTMVAGLFAKSPSPTDFVSGNVTLNDGAEMKCFIEYYEVSPGILQKGIKYLPEDIYQKLINGEKVKCKQMEKLAPKEIQSISLSNGKHFKTVNYADLTAVGAGTIPKKCIYQVILDGDITLFQKFPDVGGVTIVSGEEAQAIMNPVELTEEEKIEKAQSHYEILILKDEKMPKSISNIKLQDYISDNEVILDKFNNDEEFVNIKAVLSHKIKTGEFNERHPDYREELSKLVELYNE